jgi:simple sugar transport system permease protein
VVRVRDFKDVDYVERDLMLVRIAAEPAVRGEIVQLANLFRGRVIDVARNIVIVFALSGALAGLAGMTEVSGVVHRLQLAISPGYGFTAIIVAYIAKLNPYGVVVAAIAFGALILAGREIQPSGIPAMIQGILLFSLIASEVVLRYRVRIERRAA